jgi:hypothetical protein
VNEPVYLTYDDLRGSLKVADGQDIVQPGKIYFKDGYVFVNEYQKGIHVINNLVPAQPVIEKFIEIPGNIDMAIQGDILYADSYVDLVAIDISDLNDIKEVSRIEDAFPYILPFCENGVVEDVDETQGVVTRWRATERKVNIDEIHNRFVYYPRYEYDMNFLETNSFAAKTGASVSGTGGSMARFTLYGDYLYAIDNYMLRLFNISQVTQPVKDKEVYVGWNIETLFPYGENLFVGSTMGMYIYSLADPSNPAFLSQFWHATGCDPVVVEDNLAYVTMRAGNMCGNNLSQLDVIDISDLTDPKLLKEYTMEEPYGLGIDDDVLFVCEGEAGLKIYNAADPLKIDQNRIAHYSDINAWDVIPLGDILLMIGTDGLYQYDYSDLQDIKEISVIPIEHLTHRE